MGFYWAFMASFRKKILPITNNIFPYSWRRLFWLEKVKKTDPITKHKLPYKYSVFLFSDFII